MVVRQETVLSAPRSPDSDLTPPPMAEQASRSPVSLKLFPEQVQPANSDDVIGTTLDHFVIESRIGAGGMGTVFLARDERLQRLVALKVLSPQQTADPAAVHRFQNEARSAARLDHDHIARVFFSGDEHGLHYIAYEFVEGVNLRELIRQRGRLDPAEVVTYAAQLVSALCHTSANGVVHRDIKPSNIIITPQGKAKLVDLGLARKESLEASAQLTVAGTTLGTFDYISPEQAKDPRNVDVRSDIYSLGCTLYHALTGEPPFPDGTVLQRLLDHQDKPPPDPALKNRRVSPALAAVVRKMMAGDPKYRYPTGEDLLRDLMVISRAMGLQTLPADSTMLSVWSGSRGDWSQHGIWLAAAAALFLAAVLLQVFPDAAARWTGLESVPDETVVAWADGAGPASSGTIDSLPTQSTDRPEQPVYIPAQSAGRDKSQVTGSQTEFPSNLIPTPLQPGAVGPFAPAPMKFGPFDNALTPLTSTNLLTLPLGPEQPLITSSEAVGTKSTVGDTRQSAPIEPPRGTAVGPSPTDVEGATTALAETVSASPFLVTSTGRSYISLEAACAEIKDDGIIELDFDGRLPAAERPLRLINKRVVIRPAKGRRPILWFAPRELITDPYQSRMISVTGGTLSVVNVALELKVPETSSADLWAMFRLARPERFRLERSSVTILNPAHVAVAVAEIAAPDADAFSKMGAMKEGQPQIPSEVFIEDSLIRGEAAGLRIRDAGSLHVDFKQSLFALGEWLLQAEPETQSMSASLRLSIDLVQTTCLLGQGLLKSSESDAITGRQTPIEIRARNNIIAVGPSSALVEQRFPLTAMDARQSLIWVGERNAYDGIGQFWLVQTPGPQGEQRWDYRAWRDFWAGETSGSQNESVVWKSPWRLKEWARITAEDVHLDADVEVNPPRGVADGVDAGVTPSRLPGERGTLPNGR
jgi:serine/threonine protein kinase